VPVFDRARVPCAPKIGRWCRGGSPPLCECTSRNDLFHHSGRTPEEASTGLPEAEVIDMAAARERRLVRSPYAHGLLQGYSLVGDGATGVAA
jgi:hypothetical protein